MRELISLKHTAVLIMALGFYLPIESSGAVAERDVIMELGQFETWNVLFHPAAEGLCFAEVNGRILTNAFVLGRYHPGSRGSVRSLVDAWIDSRGHVHTVAVLERQLAFKGMYESWLRDGGTPIPGKCDFDGCWLGRGRSEPIFVRNVPLTGILDKDTLQLPFFRLALRFEDLHWRLEGTIAIDEAMRPIFDEKFLAAREAMDRLRVASALPLSIPTPSPSGALRRSPGGLSSGLEIEIGDMPVLRNPIRPGPKPSCHRLNKAPAEEAVRESVDPSLPDFSSRIAAIAAAEREATEQIEDAEFIVDQVLRADMP